MTYDGMVRVLRADFNKLWRDTERDGVIIGARSNPGLEVGERVVVYDLDGVTVCDATVARITSERVFLACEWATA